MPGSWEQSASSAAPGLMSNFLPPSPPTPPASALACFQASPCQNQTMARGKHPHKLKHPVSQKAHGIQGRHSGRRQKPPRHRWKQLENGNSVSGSRRWKMNCIIMFPTPLFVSALAAEPNALGEGVKTYWLSVCSTSYCKDRVWLLSSICLRENCSRKSLDLALEYFYSIISSLRTVPRMYHSLIQDQRDTELIQSKSQVFWY